MSYPIYYMNRRVKTVRDGKGRFATPVISEYAWRTLAVMLILPTLWCLGYFFHSIGTLVARADEPHLTEKEACIEAKQGRAVMLDGVTDREFKDICASYEVYLTKVPRYAK